MFNNLIESSSHAREYKRRGSFLLFTTGVYAMLLVLGGVASIYAYDARLEEQNLEIVTLLPPVEVVPAAPEPVSRPNQPREISHNESRVPERTIAMYDVNHPEVVPDNISTAPNKNLPLPPGPVRITGGPDRDFGSAGGPATPGSDGRVVVPPAQIITLPDQPPPPPVRGFAVRPVLPLLPLLPLLPVVVAEPEDVEEPVRPTVLDPRGGLDRVAPASDELARV